MPNLFPEDYEENVLSEEEVADDAPTGYLNGVAFDEEAGDFKLDGKNKILDSDGIDSWELWCKNCLHTERYKHLAYSTDFGIEMDAVFGAGSREEAESILVRQITEALMADPYGRTEYVENVEIEWTDPDAVKVCVTVHGIYDVTIDVTAYITRGEI